MEAYDFRGEAAGRAATVEAPGASASVAIRPGPLLEELPLRDLLLAPLNMQAHPASDSPLEFQRGTEAALQSEARALCRRIVNGNSNSERLR